MCLFGGTVLIGPMIALVFVSHSPTLTLSLVVAFVLLVALTLPFVGKPPTPNELPLLPMLPYLWCLLLIHLRRNLGLVERPEVDGSKVDRRDEIATAHTGQPLTL